MDHQLLKTFIVVAEKGSISKASECIYISATAIVKQMNLLEKETGLHLLNRTKRGTTLTESGKVFLEDAKFLVHYWDSMIEHARKKETATGNPIRIGSSILRSEKPLLNLWTKLKARHPQFKIHIVPFEDSYQNYMNIIQNLGKEIDVVAAIYPPELWGGLCNILHIDDIPYNCTMSYNHPLAQKKLLNISDLFGTEIMIVHSGRSSYVDNVRTALKQYPQITIIDVPDYTMDIFNQCETTNRLLLTTEIWNDIHPLLTTIPVNWNFTSPYGLLYAKNCSQTITDFILAIKEITDTCSS